MDAIRATIDAAYIQGFLGFFGALIGAMALIISIRIAAENTVKQIKLEKVAESKRDQYISLTDTYTRFLVSALSTNPSIRFNSSEAEKLDNWSIHLAKYIELIGSINKVNLVTSSEIRLELFKLENEIIEYQASFANYYFNSAPFPSESEIEKKVFEFAKLLRDDLGIENDFAMESNLMLLRKKPK